MTAISDRKQNAMSLLTPVSDPDFYSLTCGTTLVLPSIVAFLTIFLLVEVIEQPIRFVGIGGYLSCHERG